MNFTMRVALSMAVCLSLNARAEAAPILFAGNGHYYDFISATVTWDGALAGAAAATPFDPGTGPIPGHLVTITSAAEQAFLDTLSDGRGYWIAASDRGSEGTWSWRAGPEIGMVFWSGGLGGGPVAGRYSNWNFAEPNNAGGENVATDNLFGSNWNDWCDQCTTNYVVEFSPLQNETTPVPEPATLLLVGGGSGLLALRRRRHRS